MFLCLSDILTAKGTFHCSLYFPKGLAQWICIFELGNFIPDALPAYISWLGDRVVPKSDAQCLHLLLTSSILV